MKVDDENENGCKSWLEEEKKKENGEKMKDSEEITIFCYQLIGSSVFFSVKPCKFLLDSVVTTNEVYQQYRLIEEKEKEKE